MTTTSLLGRLSCSISFAVFGLGIAFGASQGAHADEVEVAAVSSQDPVAAVSVACDGLTEAPALYADPIVDDTESTRPVADATVTEFATVDDPAQPTDATLTEIPVPPAPEAIEAAQATGGHAVVYFPDVEITIAASATFLGEIATVYTTAPASIDTAPATEEIAPASDQSVGVAQQEPQYTNSTDSEWDGSAVKSYPDIEITIAVAATFPEEAVPLDE